MKPFLLLSVRAEEAAADDEYDAFVRFTGLAPQDLHRHRLERDPFDPGSLSSYAGVLVGGGPFNVSDPQDTKSPSQLRAEGDLGRVVDVVLAEQIPFLGACYGIGILARHGGGAVDRTYGEPIGSVPVTLTADGAADPVFGGLPRTFDAFVGHKEAVRAAPADAVLLATSPGCPVQALRIGRYAWGTQFHPELDVDGLCLRIDTYRDAGYFPPEEAADLMAVARAAHVTAPPVILRRFVALAADLSRA